MHVALRIAYDGRFPGYARQPQGDTVEDLVIAALRDDGYEPDSWRSGSRTDRGVCALANVATCRLDRPHLRGLVPAVQSRLPDGIWLTAAATVGPGFDPRRAVWREYSYTAPAGGEDLGAMRAACAVFEGRHDMRAFARMEEGRPPQRTVMAFAVVPDDGWWRFTVRGQSFLWHQVRRMVDAVLHVGLGDATAADVAKSLETGRPHGTFGVAPPGGLLLERVAFDPEPAWDPDAGTLRTRRLAEAAQQARVRAQWMASLARMARQPGD